MANLIDPISVRIHGFARAHLEEIVRSCLPLATPWASRPLPLKEDLAIAERGITDANRQILGEVRALCGQHRFFPLLMVARRVPHLYVGSMIRRVAGVGADSTTLALVYGSAMALATNHLLAFSSNDLSVRRKNDHYRLAPSDDELRAAIRLVLLCALHEFQLFGLNSTLRALLAAAPISADTLIGAYVARQERARRRSPDAVDDTSLVALGIPLPGADPIRLDVVFGPDEWVTSVTLPYYVPAFYDGDVERERFSFLGAADNSRSFIGMPFDEWWKAWRVLNQALMRLIVRIDEFLRADGTYAARSVPALAHVETLSDVGESGLISTRTGEIRDSWERELTEHPRASGPSPLNYRRFIDAVTCRRLDQSDEIEFPEQPYLFYSVGSDVLVWDLMRHGGFVNAMARRLVRGGGSIGEAKGRVFECRIMQAISRRLPRAKDVRSRLKVKDPQTRSLVFEADVALVLGQVLVLVEAKSQLKPVPYYLGSFQELGYRADKVCSELRDRDEKLRRHWTLIQARWPRQSLSGGLNILVSDQVEFIPSTSRELWLVACQP